MPNKNYTPLDSNSLPSSILVAYKHVYSKAALHVLLKVVWSLSPCLVLWQSSFPRFGTWWQCANSYFTFTEGEI